MIPLELIINWDQTSCKLVPISDWAMERQVPVVSNEDKREVTALLSITASAMVLPPQVIYKGKTECCHAKITFPEDWNMTHSINHWSTEETMFKFMDKVLVLYMANTQEKLHLADGHVTLAIFDVFQAH